MKVHFEYIILDPKMGMSNDTSICLYDRTVEEAESYTDAVTKLAIEAGVPDYTSTRYTATHVDFDLNAALTEYYAARKAAFNL